jgi:galactokinase
MSKILTEEQKLKHRLRSAKYAQKNKEKVLNASKKWNNANKEKLNCSTKKYFDKIKDTIEFKKKNSERVKKWAKENPDKVAEQSANKRATKLQRIPKWLSEEQKNKIKEYYLTARILSNAFDEEFHVDHIVPLRGKFVSGLHVPWNLTILTAQENMSKSNKFI